jgi:hypothetical protein
MTEFPDGRTVKPVMVLTENVTPPIPGVILVTPPMLLPLAATKASHFYYIFARSTVLLSSVILGTINVYAGS